MLGEDSGSDLEELVDELEYRVGGDLRSLHGELLESHESRILFA